MCFYLTSRIMKKITCKGNSEQPAISRRNFIQASSALIALPFVSSTATAQARAVTATENRPAEKVVQTCSTFDCGGKCDIRVHVNEGIVTRISTRPDNALDAQMPVMRACVRGRAYRKFVYHPDRLKYPMKRVGKRGEGKFERISWDEATTLIAANLKSITAKYGPASRYVHVGTAVSGGTFSGDKMVRRLLNLTGGYLESYHSVSMGNTAAATPYTYGTAASGSSLDTLLETKLVILWGHNPTETIFGHTNYFFQKMKQNGTRFIVVDPRYSDTVASLADQWIPLLPTTDNALMDAMMYVIISENLHDRAFIERYAIGFDEGSMPEGVPANESLVAYLTGAKDGVVKSPEWAEKITHVPAQTIRQLARDYANTKPAALIQGWGPQRHNCGERTARGSTLLATITGNVGIKGGWAAGYGGCANRKFAAGPEMPDNPVKAKISVMNWVQASDDASKVTPDVGLKDADKLDSNIRILFSLAGNYLANQNPDLHQAVRVLEDESRIQFIVASDLFMTPSAKYADLLLPETSFMERWNIGETWGTASYLILSEKLIEPEFERRSDYDWLREVAAKLDIENEFSQGRDEKAWIEHIWEQTRLAMPDENLPDFATLRKTRQHLFKSAPSVAFEDNIRDPDNHPFPTPSGKIEIFSKRLFDMQHPEIPALSHYVPAHEGPEDALAKDFPLQLITWKGKNRANSTQYANPWLIEVQQQKLWINPQDAQKRGIKHGDMVRIHNQRGICEIPAEVTPRIIPGVVAMQAGAWWQPDENGIDKGGCANVLSSARITALAKGNSHQTMLVEVAKA
ncbi:dimethyl sulfoxide reductase subunit A [Salmonella enterica subsp. arizonae serovar 41:z4,z23:-]|uniref:Molybdopterin-dependent oxidoreductase n=1 Tax=Salmonella enterica subsp. arizonae TaxID=59203 RepID=A0A632U173_SALER|nr:dimethyl sulfoxide reductase subunit A [Salmonella enterica]EDH0571036.1 molybdopterin-dependent oxidoreductase [Salmonella enterica subsp. arizonae]EEJ5250964.1 molybdopterin-dependent oxidoreductase [Salmonella enterica subsp. enterica serovar Waycross]EGE4651948.1 molybdopterin-dependent oxidoreductase [Salmonella enterica subsp. arizonae serovar 41:z4,z23:- str. 01-0089]OSE50496.1 dimethyl sulfoxide reductase subunit A [Salmonella enterica subsp. arizonae serovar 41:z4,z23:-]